MAAGTRRLNRTPSQRHHLAWSLLAAALFVAGVWLRGWQLRRQLLIDDEWHALHKLLTSGYADIASHFGLADYCIPLTLFYRALFDLGWLSEWTMHLPPLLAGVALIAAGWRLLKYRFDIATRTIWLGLVSLSPVLVYLSRTARPYTLAALAVLVALFAIVDWWQTRRAGQAITYVVATTIAGWLHLMTLPFALSPLLLFGAITLASLFGAKPQDARITLRRLLLIGTAIAMALLALLLPPLINDWDSLAQKSGGGAVTPRSLWRTWLMLAGTGHAMVGIVMAALTGYGMWRSWQHDRLFTGCVLFSFVLGGSAIIASQPAWIQHPGVLARYLMPMLALLLVFVAHGVANVVARLPNPAVGAGTAVLSLALVFATGPIPDQLHRPNQFYGHARLQFDYDAAHNPYFPQRETIRDGASPFYRSLSALPPGSVTLIEVPWRLESNYVHHDELQRLHRQRIKAGMVGGVCGTSWWGDFSRLSGQLHFREHVPLRELLDGATWGADYLVMRQRPPTGPGGEPAPDWPDVGACLPVLAARFGDPVYRDDDITVFTLASDRH